MELVQDAEQKTRLDAMVKLHDDQIDTCDAPFLPNAVLRSYVEMCKTQGFADELVRVWPPAHPQTTLQVIQANESIQNRVSHALSRKDLPSAKTDGHPKPI